MLFFICRWHLCRFLPIGGTNVDLIGGGTNVAVGVAKTSLGKNVGSTKVAPPLYGVLFCVLLQKTFNYILSKFLEFLF
jgi:hypothetical protein